MGRGRRPPRAATGALATRVRPRAISRLPGASLVYAVFTFYPVLRTFYNSVHLHQGPHNVEEFVGSQNFIDILTQDPVFWKAVGNTATFTIVGTIADVLGGPVAGALPFRRHRASRAPCGSIWFTPVLMSYVVVGIIWVWLYDYDWGLDQRRLALARPRLPSSNPGWAIPTPRSGRCW